MDGPRKMPSVDNWQKYARNDLDRPRSTAYRDAALTQTTGGTFSCPYLALHTVVPCSGNRVALRSPHEMRDLHFRNGAWHAMKLGLAPASRSYRAIPEG